MSRHRKLNRQQIVFVASSLTPVYILFITFTLLPILMSFGLAFGSYDALANRFSFTGLDNWKQLLSDSLFLESVRNTFRFVLIAVPANLIITLGIALVLHQVRNARMRNGLRTVMFLPVIAPVVGSVLVWQSLYNYNDGLFNQLLSFMGLVPQDWLTDPALALPSVILMVLWADIGYNIILFMSGLNSIPDQFYEAAKLDGASRFGLFRHITLPLLSRTTLFVTIMTLLSYFQAFTQFSVMTGGGPDNATRVLSLNIYDTAFKYFDMGYAGSMAIFLFGIMLVITLFQLKVGKSRWEY